MKFTTPDDQPVYVGKTSGHTFVLAPGEPQEVPAMFHRELIAAGGVPEGAVVVKSENAMPQFDQKKVIRLAIEAMLREQDPKDFSADGRIDQRRVAGRIGFQPERGVIQQVLDQLDRERTKPDRDDDA